MGQRSSQIRHVQSAGMDLRSRIRISSSWELHGDITTVFYIVSRSVEGVAGRTVRLSRDTALATPR